MRARVVYAQTIITPVASVFNTLRSYRLHSLRAARFDIASDCQKTDRQCVDRFEEKSQSSVAKP